MRRLLFAFLWALLYVGVAFGQNNSALTPQALPGLNLLVRGGNILLGGSSIGISNTTVILGNNTTTYVFLSTGGAIQTNTTGYAVSVLPIATVVTSQGQIIDIQDNRPDYIFGGGSSGSAVVTVTSSATPTFTVTSSPAAFTITDFFMQLTANVTSSTMAGTFKQGDEVVVTLQQDGVGGRTFTWPATFLNAPAVQSGANLTTAATFQFCGTVGSTACPANDWQNTDISPTGAIPSAANGPLFFYAYNYGVLADVQVNWAPSWSSGSNIITCTTCNFNTTAKVGQIIFGSNVNPLGAASNGTAVLQLPQTTIQSIDSNTQIHTVGNANANWTQGPLIWGDDDTANLQSAWTAAANACGTLLLPAGRMFTTKAQFITAPTTQCANNVGTARFGPAVTGTGMGQTTIIPTPSFDSTTCTGNTSACFFSYAVPFAGGMIAKDFTIWGGGNSAIGAGFSGKWLVDFGANTAATNFTISAWGGNTSGTTGLHVSSFPVVLTNVESDGAGAQTCQVSDATSVVAVVFNGVYCGDSNGTGGVAALEINGGALASSNSFYFNMPGNSCDVEEDASGIFQSVNDTIGANTNANTLGLCVASTGIAYVTNDRVQGNTAVDLLGTGTLHASQTIFTGNTTAILNASGTSFFDDGGNTFTGTTKFTQSAGALFGSASITGVTQTSGNWSVPAGASAGQWGTTPTVACPGTLEGSAGSSNLEACTITVGSGTVGANPILTITWPVPFLIPPNCSAKMTGGTAALANFTSGVPTTTTGTFTYQGTPGASTTIGLVVTCGNG